MKNEETYLQPLLSDVGLGRSRCPASDITEVRISFASYHIDHQPVTLRVFSIDDLIFLSANAAHAITIWRYSESIASRFLAKVYSRKRGKPPHLTSRQVHLVRTKFTRQRLTHKRPANKREANHGTSTASGTPVRLGSTPPAPEYTKPSAIFSSGCCVV